MEDRLEIWLELLAVKLDRLIELGENVERASRSHEMPEEWGEHEGDHFAGADKMVSEGPNNLRISIARELEGYRLVNDSDIGKIVEVQNSTADPWRECTLLAIDWDRPYGFLCRHVGFYRPMQWRFARIKIDEPAKEEPAEQPPKKWRILEPGEVVCSSDWICARSNLPSDPPNGLGWKPQICSTGISVSKHDDCVFARPVADEPAKESEHPAGPMPDPGEGCCEPTEKGIGGDIEVIATASWIRGRRSPAEPPASENPAEPQYRTPSLPEDAGKVCEFINDEDTNLWVEQRLCGYKDQEYLPWISEEGEWHQARIKIEDKSLPPKPSPDASVAMPEGKENPYISSSWSGLFDWILNAKSPQGGSLSMRAPKIPDDFGKICQFSHREDMLDAKPFKLVGWRMGKWISDDTEFNSEGQEYQYCQIESPYHRR